MKIHTKILLLIIFICAFSTISISVASYITVKNISDYALENNQNIRYNTEEAAGSAMLDLTRYFLQMIADEQSINCNNVLNDIKSDVQMIAGAMHDILTKPEYHQRQRPIIYQGDITPGVYSNAWLLPEYETMNADRRREIALMSNMEIIMPTLTLNPNIIEFYTGLTSGLLYAYTPIQFGDPQYDPRKRPWYIKALEYPGETIFTDVYEDAFGKGMIITSALTVHDDNGSLLGVASIDLKLTSMTEMILETSIMETGYAFILDSTGRYVVHPDMGKDGFQEYPLEVSDPEESIPFKNGYQRMMRGEEGFISEVIDGEGYYLTFRHIPAANWSIGFIVPEKEILSSLKIMTEQLNSFVNQSEKSIISMTENAFFLFIAIIAIIVAMVVIVSVNLSNFISRPIKNLTEEIANINEGNLTYKIAIKSNDEIGILTEAFNKSTERIHQSMQSILELNNANSQLKNDAYTDSLTGIYNRRYFMQLAQLQMDRLLNENSCSFVIIFDVDHFKKVNDKYGHAVGDDVLNGIVARAREIIRSDDVFARFGGEEFILFIANADQPTVFDLAERIRINISKTPIEVNDITVNISASFGIAPATPVNNLDTAIKLADESLYMAKNAGRNKVVFSK